MTVFFDRSSTAEALGSRAFQFKGVSVSVRIKGLDAERAIANHGRGTSDRLLLCFWQNMLALFRASATPLRRQHPSLGSQAPNQLLKPDPVVLSHKMVWSLTTLVSMCINPTSFSGLGGEGLGFQSLLGGGRDVKLVGKRLPLNPKSM